MFHTVGTITSANRDNITHGSSVDPIEFMEFLQNPYNFKSFKKILLDNLERIYPELKEALGRDFFRMRPSSLANDEERRIKDDFEEDVIGKLEFLLNKTDPKSYSWRKNVQDWIRRGIGGSFATGLSVCFALKLTVYQTNTFLAKADLGPLTSSIADDVIYMYWLARNADEKPDEDRDLAKYNLEHARIWIQKYQQNYSADPEAITTRNLKEAIDFSLDPDVFYETYLAGGQLPPFLANEAAWNILVEQMDRAKLTLINQNLEDAFILRKIQSFLKDETAVSSLKLNPELCKELNEAIKAQLKFGGKGETIRILWTDACKQALSPNNPEGLGVLSSSILGKLTDFMSLVFPGKPLHATNPINAADGEISISELFELFPDDRNLKLGNLKKKYLDIDCVKKAQKARNYTPIRKGIILFFFINYYFENGNYILKSIKDCPDDTAYKEILDDYRKEIDILLESCQLPTLYEANQFDCLILKSIYQYYNSVRDAFGNEDEESENPYEFFTSVIELAYDNALDYDL